MKLMIFTLLLFLIPITADARCGCMCVNGQYVPICKDTLNASSISCGIKKCPRTSPTVRPIEPTIVPPIGTAQCRDRRVYNLSTGIYQMKRVCR